MTPATGLLLAVIAYACGHAIGHASACVTYGRQLVGLEQRVDDLTAELDDLTPSRSPLYAVGKVVPLQRRSVSPDNVPVAGDPA